MKMFTAMKLILATSFLSLALLAMTAGAAADDMASTTSGLEHKNVLGGLVVKVCNGDFESQSVICLCYLFFTFGKQLTLLTLYYCYFFCLRQATNFLRGMNEISADGDYSSKEKLPLPKTIDNSVAMSADGTRIALCAIAIDDNGSNSGHIRILDLVGTDWVQLGQNIEGALGDRFGNSVAMSANGNRVAIGAIAIDENGSNSVHVRILDWDATRSDWIQVGQAINGEAADDLSGFAVAMSADGTRVAIGVRFNDGSGYDSGHVRILDWDATKSDWIQVGQAINGEATDDLHGFAVAMSADGTRVAIGARFNDGNGPDSGHVRILDLQFDAGEQEFKWVQVGQDIDGEAAGDQSGLAVAISENGNRVAIGAHRDDDNGISSGHVRILDLQLVDETEFKWVQVGKDIDGEAAGDQSGIAVAISAYGNRVAIGARLKNDGNGSDSGHVRILDWDATKSDWIQIRHDMEGEAAGDHSGISVAMSADGVFLLSTLDEL
jgi:hypothetical protein